MSISLITKSSSSLLLNNPVIVLIVGASANAADKSNHKSGCASARYIGLRCCTSRGSIFGRDNDALWCRAVGIIKGHSNDTGTASGPRKSTTPPMAATTSMVDITNFLSPVVERLTAWAISGLTLAGRLFSRLSSPIASGC